MTERTQQSLAHSFITFSCAPGGPQLLPFSNLRSPSHLGPQYLYSKVSSELVVHSLQRHDSPSYLSVLSLSISLSLSLVISARSTTDCAEAECPRGSGALGRLGRAEGQEGRRAGGLSRGSSLHSP